MRSSFYSLSWKTISAISLTLHYVEAASSSGCGTALPSNLSSGGPSQNFTIQVNGVLRSYLLYIPINYDINTAAPLILNYHGGTLDPPDQEQVSGMSSSQFNKNSIVAYPDGINDSWEGDPGVSSSNDDISFAGDMIQFISSSYCIDTARIYATGLSDGGGFLGLLACDPKMSTSIAAFAPVAGAFYNQISGAPCSASRTPIPIIEFHGSDDNVIPYGGGSRKGSTLPSISSWLQGWASRDGVTSTNVTTNEFNGNVVISTWMESNSAVTVGYYVIGLGHAWPSTTANAYYPVGTYFNATPIIMDFFANHTISAVSSACPSASFSASGSSPSSSTSSPSATASSQSHLAFSVDILAIVMPLTGIISVFMIL